MCVCKSGWGVCMSKRLVWLMEMLFVSNWLFWVLALGCLDRVTCQKWTVSMEGPDGSLCFLLKLCYLIIRMDILPDINSVCFRGKKLWSFERWKLLTVSLSAVTLEYSSSYLVSSAVLEWSGCLKWFFSLHVPTCHSAKLRLTMKKVFTWVCHSFDPDEFELSTVFFTEA